MTAIWVGAFLMIGAASCFSPARRVATSADLQQLGTRSYAGHDRAEVVQAAVTALKVLGYEVVTTDPRVRTAPKIAAVTAAGRYTRYSGVSQTYAESVAWDIDVQQDPQGATLHAVPRASVNGQPMDQVYYDWADGTFNQLLHEIDGTLAVKR